MSVSPSLEHFIDDELSRAAALADTTVDAVLAETRQRREALPDPSRRDQRHALMQALSRDKAAFVEAFADSLRRRVRADTRTEAAPAPAPTLRSLELMDETRVEADIEISGTAQRIAGVAEWELRELQSFMSALAGLPHVDAKLNPLQPLAYAQALWDAAGSVTTVAADRALLSRTLGDVLAAQLRKAWAAACTRLEAQGIEPSVYRTMVFASGPGEQELSIDVTRPGVLEELLSSMPGGGSPATPPAASRTLAPALREALDRLGAVLDGVGPAGAATLAEHRAALLASASGTVDRQVVELLSRLFEAVLSDGRLPARFRHVIARLQVSALRVALVDAAMLKMHDHAVWRLMNRIAALAEACPKENDPRGIALHDFCEALVDDIVRAPNQDATLWRQALPRLDAFVDGQLREPQMRARAEIESLSRAEELEATERHLAMLLEDQLAPLQPPATVRRFVTTVWARILARSIQHHGEQGEPTLALMRTTDDLLWSVSPPDHPQSRKRLLAMLPGLLQRLRAALQSIDMPEADQQPVFDALMALHTEALRPAKTAAEPTPAEIVQRMRDETEWTPPHRPPFRDSLIDLHSMETVPADVLQAPADAPSDATQRIAVLLPGDRLRVFLRGEWDRIQLLGRSARGGYLLFAGTDPQRLHSITRRALERLAEVGLVVPSEDVSLVQRAFDSVTRRMTF
jgi:hypothetical protein